MNKRPEEFFTYCSRVRGKLVHGKLTHAELGQLGAAAAEFERLVGKVLSADLADVEL